MKKLLLPTVLAVSLVASAQAQSTWVGDQDADWFTDNAGNTNWSSDTIPNAIGASVVFDATSTTPNPLSITINSNVTVGDFTYTGAPSAITLSGAGVITMDDGTGSNNFLSTGTSVDFTINNDMIFTSGQSNVINFNSTGVINFNGNISGVAGIRQNNGSGTLNFAGNNTYSGPTWIDRGNVAITSGTGLGSGAINWRVAGGAAANLVVNASTSIGNALVLVDSGGAASNRIRNADGVTSTFTTNSITAAAGEVLELNNLSGTGTYRFTGASLTTDVSVNIISSNNTLELAPASGTQTWSGVIQGGGLVTKTGAGTAILSGDNTYTSTTTVSAGTLLIDGSHSGTGAITVESGAVLGRSPTTALSLGGDVTFEAGSGVRFELNGTDSSSLARTGGTWSIANNLAFTFTGLEQVGATYALFTGLAADIVTGNSWTITNSGWTGDFSYNAGTVNFNLTAVPEPSTAALFGLALGGLALLRRRMRQS